MFVTDTAKEHRYNDEDTSLFRTNERQISTSGAVARRVTREKKKERIDRSSCSVRYEHRFRHRRFPRYYHPTGWDRHCGNEERFKRHGYNPSSSVVRVGQKRSRSDKVSIFVSVKAASAGTLRRGAALCVRRVAPQCMLTHIRVVAISDPSFPQRKVVGLRERCGAERRGAIRRRAERGYVTVPCFQRPRLKRTVGSLSIFLSFSFSETSAYIEYSTIVGCPFRFCAFFFHFRLGMIFISMRMPAGQSRLPYRDSPAQFFRLSWRVRISNIKLLLR